MDLWLPTPESAPEIPKWFLRQLREIDKGLVIYWNRFRGRFIIDRCIHANEHIGECTVSCERTNVMIVESQEGGYMPPNERVIEKIKSIDAWTKYGAGEAGLMRQRKERENAKAEHDQKQIEDAKDNYKRAMLEDRAQINKARHLIQQHDLERIH